MSHSQPNPSSLRAADRRARVLVVDDEPTLLEMVTLNLRREGYQVETAVDGLEALEKARSRPLDLIVLDIMLPSLDGFQVVRTLRAESPVPILVLSARGEAFDRVLGLELGADDYLTKPFAMRELLARVRSLLRRAQMPAVRSDGPAEVPIGATNGRSSTADSARSVVAGDLTVDAARRQARRSGVVLNLKPKEFDLLSYIVRHPGIVLSRKALLREVWGYDFPVDTRTVDVHISWLRQKIEEDPSKPRRIETVRGHGYRFVPEPS